MGGSSSKKQAPIKSTSPTVPVEDVISNKSESPHVQNSAHVQANPPAHVQSNGSPDVHVTDSHELFDDVEDMVAPKTPPPFTTNPSVPAKTTSFNQDVDLPAAPKLESFSRENSFPSPLSSPSKPSTTTRPPLQFDQTNTSHSLTSSSPLTTSIHRQPPQPAPGGVVPSSSFVTSSGLMTSSNTGQINLNQSTRHFSSGRVGDESAGYSKSQNFYGKQKEASGRYNSYSGVENHTPSHFSGVYNRHVTEQKQSRDTNNSDVASLLKKDKFSLLGSQLQQQESRIHTRNTQPTNGTHNHGFSSPSSSSTAPTSTILRFDPNKFRKVNEVSCSSAVPGFGGFSAGGGFGGGGGGFSSIRKGGVGGVSNTSLGVSGPLDDRDEELIASIEREFDFTSY